MKVKKKRKISKLNVRNIIFIRNQVTAEYRKTSIRGVLIQDDDYHDIKHIRVIKFVEVGENKDTHNQIFQKSVGEENKEKHNEDNGKNSMEEFIH